MMLRLGVFAICLGVCLCQTYTGTYNTISSTLRSYFTNSYNSYNSKWTTSTDYTSSGMPTYAVTCSGTPNTATSRINTLKIPSTQTLSSTYYCTPMSDIGYAVNGVAIFNAASADDEDAYTAEGSTFDGCGCHAQEQGIYHYHIVPGSTCPSTAGKDTCFTWNKVTEYTPSTGTTYLVGVALDGFPIFVTVSNGAVVEETNLDVCGGKGYTYSGTNYYAYFIRPKFPYTLGCFRGQITTGYSSNTLANSLATCSGMSSSYICYCKTSSTATVKSCLPAKGATTCTVGASADCNISGTCLNTVPGSSSIQSVSYTAMLLVALYSITRLYFW